MPMRKSSVRIEYHVLPDGTVTPSSTRYIREWKKFAAPILKALNARLIGFDPGLLIRTDRNTTYDIPTAIAKLLHIALMRDPNICFSCWKKHSELPITKISSVRRLVHPKKIERPQPKERH